MTSRLQLGAGRFENIDPVLVRIFADPTWIHLGDEYSPPGPLLDRLSGKSPSFIFRQVKDKLRKVRKHRHTGEIPANVYNLTDFRPFLYVSGDTLPFADGCIDFIYSEHFFEHLFLDEAVELFKECRRIMRPGAIIRTCVPDAQLKISEGPEPAGFPDLKMDFTNPLKHKTQWSVYSLSAILQLVGLIPIPITYCSKTREFIQNEPNASDYPDNPDLEMTLRTDYIGRPDSLIIDGRKPYSQL